MTQRTSEEVMRDEFIKAYSESKDDDLERLDGAFKRQGFEFFYDDMQYRFEGFQLGQKSLAAKVPVEAIQDSIGCLKTILEHGAKYAPGNFAKNGPAVSGEIEQLESFLATIRSLQ